jgi:hypothetical protein
MWDPMKPAPPVTRIFILPFPSVDPMPVFLRECRWLPYEPSVR